MSSHPQKTINFIITSTVLGVVLYLLYPFAQTIYAQYDGDAKRTQYYQYTMQQPITVSGSIGQTPATAVPILMYHGVVDHVDIENTTQKNFIAQMEMLKAQGYQTITVQQMDDAFHGKFVLPPKPIIITFDDGRKDSYYSTDDIFRTLGFNATLFAATIKANINDKFYLGWDELRTMHDSGRWELEAHGRNSHEKVRNSFPDSEGRFLTSRIYSFVNGLETVQQFKTRVEQDYRDGIDDIKKNLGIDPHYFAVPLNDYGEKINSNYPGAVEFNQLLTKKYFDYAFVEAVNNVDSFYNFPDDDPHRLMRIEVKNMSADDLKTILERGAPPPHNLTLSGADPKSFERYATASYGSILVDSQGLHMLPTVRGNTVKVVFGDRHWNNYAVTAEFARPNTRTVSLLAYHADNNNYLSFGVTDTKTIFLREVYNGTETDLFANTPVDLGDINDFTLTLTVTNQLASGYVNGKHIFVDMPVSNSKGQAGVKTWTDTLSGHVILKSIEFSSNQ